MKNTFKYIPAIFAAVLAMATSSVANARPLPPTDDGVRLYKQISEKGSDGYYTITLDTYVTGASQTISSETVAPCDIILIVDVSTSMSSDQSQYLVTIKDQKITTGSLSTGTNYKYVAPDGQEYYLKMYSNNSKFYVRYKKGNYPTGYNDGLAFPGTENGLNYRYQPKSEDNIYTVKQSTRMPVLKDALKQFLQTVYENSPEATEAGTQQYHKVALIPFANNYKSSLAVDLTDVKKNGSNWDTVDWDTKISNLTTTSGTYPAYGFEQALTILNRDAVKNDGRKKIILFFTDGNPGSNPRNFSESDARNAVNLSYVCKQSGNLSSSVTYNSKTYSTGCDATVYSVALLGPGEENTNIRHFLHFCSNNYKDKRMSNSDTFTGNQGAEDPHDYYQLSDGSDLESIFQKIAEESSTGSATTQLGASTTRVVDVVSSNFMIPSDAEDIDVHVESFFGTSLEQAAITDRTDESYSDIWVAYDPTKTTQESYFVPEKDAQGHNVLPSVVRSKEDGKDVITVTNFFFSKDDGKTSDGTAIDYNTDGTVKYPGNWVGSRDRKPGTSGQQKLWYGNKLVISFKVKLDPDYEPGYGVPSNDSSSGIQVWDADKEEWTTPWHFDVPSIDVPGICILKDGLNIGESSIFNVANSDASKNYAVALTQRANKNGTKLACYSIMKVGAGKFTITENTAWSWTYTPVGETIQTQEIKGLTKEEVKAIKNNIINSGTEIYSNESISLGKTYTEGNVTYCILNDAEGEVTEAGSVVVLYYFKNTKTVASPGNAESIAHNVFKGGTRQDEPNVEIGGEEVEDM